MFQSIIIGSSPHNNLWAAPRDAFQLCREWICACGCDFGQYVGEKHAAFAQDPNAKTPYSEQWHATIEQQIPYSTVLKVAYVGTRGLHLDDLRDINAGQLGLAGATTVSAVRPYRFFAQINQIETHQISNYDALQVTAERRGRGPWLAHFLHLQPCLDEGTGSPGSVLNPSNIASDYGNSDENIPNRFVLSATYELPFKNSGVLKPVVEGWQLNGILQYYDGFRFLFLRQAEWATALRRSAIHWSKRQRIALKQSADACTVVRHGSIRQPPAGAWGNSGRNILQGPGTKNVDFSSSRTPPLRRKYCNYAPSSSTSSHS